MTTPEREILDAAEAAAMALTAVKAYGEGWLVDTALTYADGHTVRLLVQPGFTLGWIVTDRREAVGRLQESGVDPLKPAVRVRIQEIAAGLGSHPDDDPMTYRIEGELWKLVERGSQRLPETILEVARAAIEVDRLRTAARTPADQHFIASAPTSVIYILVLIGWLSAVLLLTLGLAIADDVPWMALDVGGLTYLLALSALAAWPSTWYVRRRLANRSGR